ncbi:T9SS type A sorting domain-containing protein [Aurantibacillus circumpalustris]|uniref:T9SS type A sorting domain-containing protein n=1 Tax=Aurantibacillus circumpalustris TaxID=3036359 RepID=UPI00295BB3EC|nr:T9SS type A sorting domain-containing protein [Aurantibacillus circumpalustris]
MKQTQFLGKPVKALTIFFCLIFSLVICGDLHSQNVAPPHPSITLLGNTGVNVATTTAMTSILSGNDPRWTVNNSTVTGVPAVIAPAPPITSTNCVAWSPNGTGGAPSWITAPNLICSGALAGYSCSPTLPPPDLYFKLTFTLAPNPVLSINWQLFASDWIHSITVNGVPAYTTNIIGSNYPLLQRINAVRFNWCTNWKGGSNEIIVRVKMIPGLAPECRYAGLKVEAVGLFNYMVYSSISGPTLLCTPTSAQYTAATALSVGIPTNVATTYSWSKPSGWGGPPSTNSLLSVVSQTIPGIVSVGILTLTSHGYDCISAAGYSVTVPPPLTITPVTPTVCTGKSVLLTVSGAVNYTWNAPGGAQIATTNTVLVSPTTVNNFVYTAIGGGTGCVYTKTVLVKSFLTPTVSAVVSPTALCQAGSANLTVTGNGWHYFILNFPPASSQVFSNTPISIGTASTTTYTALVQSIQGCTNTALTTLSIIPNPTVTSVANPSVVCSGGSSTLTASGASSYNWLGIGSGSSIVVTPTASTTYTVKGSSGPCVGTSTVKVSTLAAPVITVSPPAICPGITNTLTAGGALNYTWYIGSPVQTFTGTPTITFNSSVAVSYTVLGSGPTNSCVAQYTGTVPLGSPIPIVAPDVVLCTNAGLCTTVVATSTLTSPVSYTWQTSPPLTGSLVSVCPSVATVYTVSASSFSLGCPSSATMAVSIASNCCAQPTAGMIQLPSSGIGGTYANNSYVLSSAITLTSSTFFQNAEVWITEGVSIKVPSGMQLDLDHTHLFGCGIKMWQGIIVQDGGQITAVNTRTSNSMIEDAIVAIDLDQVSATNSGSVPPIEISRIIFNRNYIGIRISNAAPNLTTLSLGISGCVFSSKTMTYTTFPSTVLTWPNNDHTNTPGALRWPTASVGGLAPPYGYLNTNFAQVNLKQPYTSQPAHIGIQIENFGDPTGNTVASGSTVSPNVEFGFTQPAFIANDFNLFDGIGNGIDINEGNLRTMFNVFQNLQYYNTPSGWFGGVGINHEISDSSLMNATLDLRTGGNYFWDCVTGINAHNVFECWVTGSTFRSTHSVLTANLPLQTTQGDVGVNYESNRFNFTVFNSEFNNIRNGIIMRTPLTTYPYNIFSLSYGIYPIGFGFNENYFGAEVNSSAPYSSTSANTSEYMNDAITLETPNLTGWNTGNPTGTGCFITSNKINRAFRGIRINGMEHLPTWVSTNEILLEDDATYSLPQYGVALENHNGAMNVFMNTVTATQIWPAANGTVSALYFYNNQDPGYPTPVVECNTETETYYGYHFDGSNTATEWKNNTMCSNYAGLALTNSAVIGPQGNQNQANQNIWLNTPWCGSNWGQNTAQNQTYCENSTASLSPLYVQNLPSTNPVLNTSFPNPSDAYDMSGAPPSIFLNNNPIPDCPATSFFVPPPSWRLANSSTIAPIQDELDENKLSIFPNPTNGRLTIVSEGSAENLSVSVFDLAGKQILVKSNLSGNENSLDVSELAASIYIITISSDSGKTIHRKLVKTD